MQIAKQAEEEDNLNLAGQMYKELAQYVAPKRKSIEMAISPGNKDVKSMTDEELLAIASGIKQ